MNENISKLKYKYVKIVLKNRRKLTYIYNVYNIYYNTYI